MFQFGVRGKRLPLGTGLVLRSPSPHDLVLPWAGGDACEDVDVHANRSKCEGAACQPPVEGYAVAALLGGAVWA